MPDADLFDLDEFRDAHVAENPLTYRNLKLYGRTWQVRKDPNIAVLLRFADSGGTRGQLNFVLGYIKAEEREAFHEAIEADEYFDENFLGKLVDYFTEETAGKDGSTSSISEASSSTSGTNSTGSSSVEEAVSVASV